MTAAEAAAGAALVFLGAPGSGKGTYARLLARTLPLAVRYIEVGSLLRDAARKEEEEEEEQEIVAGMQRRRASGGVASAVARGELVEDAGVVEALVWRELCAARATRSVALLDGFPRTPSQASWLLEHCGASRVPLVFHLSLHAEAAAAKCGGRLQCARCGAGFNDAEVDMPLESGERLVLPRLEPPKDCRASMRRREDDDTPGVVAARIRLFESTNAHVLRVFEEAGYSRAQSTSIRESETAENCNARTAGESRVVHDIELTRGIPETAALIARLAARSAVFAEYKSAGGKEDVARMAASYGAPKCGLLPSSHK